MSHASAAGGIPACHVAPIYWTVSSIPRVIASHFAGYRRGGECILSCPRGAGSPRAIRRSNTPATRSCESHSLRSVVLTFTVYHGRKPATRVGLTFAHEFIGVVDEVGPSMQHLKVGDRVMVPFNVFCGSCFFCARGLYSNCHNVKANATAVGQSTGTHTPLAATTVARLSSSGCRSRM